MGASVGCPVTTGASVGANVDSSVGVNVDSSVGADVNSEEGGIGTVGRTGAGLNVL